LDEKLDRLIDDIQDLRHGVTSLEGQVAGLQSGLGSIRADMAPMSSTDRAPGHGDGAAQAAPPLVG